MTLDESSANRFMTDNEAAEMLGFAVQTLRDWRSTQRVDLPYIKIGRSVRYRYGDLIEFMEARRVGGRGAQS